MLFGSATPVTSTTNAPLFLLPNGTFLFELVIFIIVLGIVARVILPPITAAIREREATIRRGIEAGEEGRAEADRLAVARRSRLDGARAEARAILEEAQRTAEAKRGEGRQRGQVEYERIVNEAAGAIDLERRRTIDEVSGSLESLVVEAAAHIVGASVDPARHRHTLDRVRTELGSSDGVGR